MNTPASVTAATPLAKHGRSAWAEFRRSAVYMVALCCGIAVMLTVIDRGGFASKLLYSFCIGFFCWLIINGGRYAVASAQMRKCFALGQSETHHSTFPGWGWMSVLMIAGMGLGPILGTATADYLTGNGRLDLSTWGSRGSQITIVIDRKSVV